MDKLKKHRFQRIGTMEFSNESGIYRNGANKLKSPEKEEHNFIVPWQQY